MLNNLQFLYRGPIPGYDVKLAPVGEEEGQAPTGGAAVAVVGRVARQAS